MEFSKEAVKKKLVTLLDRASMLDGEQHLLVSMAAPNISMITINRPEQRNLLTHRTRAQLFNQLQMNDQDPDVRVTIIRGSDGIFSSGNDFDTYRKEEVLPFFEPDFDGQTSRHVLNGWLMMNDLSKPVIAMVEGDAIGGGLELAAACDVCICANNANLGYGPIRGQGLADYQILPWMCGMRNAMELVLTNGTMNGIEAVNKHFATLSVPEEELEQATLDLATRIAKIPSDLLSFNKKSVHRAFEAQGMRTNLRNAVDLETLMFKAPGSKMLTARRGPQRGKPIATRLLPPRPHDTLDGAVSAQTVGAQTVGAQTMLKPTLVTTKPSLTSSPNKTPIIKPSSPSVTKQASVKPSSPSVTKQASVTKPVATTIAKSTTPAVLKKTDNSIPLSSPIKEGSNDVHIHLHEAIYIHFDDNKISKL
jgi:enoyl-CoA hydratase